MQCAQFLSDVGKAVGIIGEVGEEGNGVLGTLHAFARQDEGVRL